MLPQGMNRTVNHGRESVSEVLLLSIQIANSGLIDLVRYTLFSLRSIDQPLASLFAATNSESQLLTKSSASRPITKSVLCLCRVAAATRIFRILSRSFTPRYKVISLAESLIVVGHFRAGSKSAGK